MRWLRGTAFALMLLTSAVQAQQVVLAGRMGDKALLVIDGRALTLGVGDSAEGVRLLRWVDGSAELTMQGQARLFRVGETPARISGTPPPRTAGRELVIAAGPGGHFRAIGAINGKSVSFLVDTGATLVALGNDQVERLGIDLSQGRAAITQTANGPVTAHLVTLSTVRVGELELSNVGAVVMPQPMPMVLLGNSFLARLQMRRDNDVMHLEKR